VLVLVFANEVVIFSFYTVFVFVNDNHTAMYASVGVENIIKHFRGEAGGVYVRCQSLMTTIC